MTVRERMEQEEYDMLAPHAQKAAEPFAQTLRELSAGRLVPEKIGSVFRGVLRK